MKQSELFAKTTKDISKEELSKNAQFLTRAGFINKLMSGVYSYLPLGLLVFKKIENIIREEINKIGGQEVLLPSLHPQEVWLKTDRWQYEEMFKIKSRAEKEFGLGWTHEEIITSLMKNFIKSYKDLPVYAYQIQTKFRDELRAKSGLLRAVEFAMKDLYSFHSDVEDLDKYYEKVKETYFKIFERCGLKEKTYLTLAAGGVFSKYSHEFQTVTDSGEDEIYLCKKCNIAVNKEIIEEQNHECPKCKNKNLEVKKSIEVGNIFKLGDRFSKAFEVYFTDKNSAKQLVQMGCYGIGLGRLMGAVVEALHDENGIIWPKNIAPFLIHLVEINNSKTGEENKKVSKTSEEIYQNLMKKGIDVLYDDRKDKTVGEKFADADLMGIPWRVVVSERTLEKDSIEIKSRTEKDTKLVKIKDIAKFDF